VTGRADPLALRPPSMHAFEQADHALGLAGLFEADIFRAELRAAIADVSALVEAARFTLIPDVQGTSADKLRASRERLRAALAPFGESP
jgi:hypothetical protein